MSCGIVVCKTCRREVHQHGNRKWFHCQDKTPLCEGSEVVYPEMIKTPSGKQIPIIAGPWCGIDRCPD
jgi:hypothetical protein